MWWRCPLSLCRFKSVLSASSGAVQEFENEFPLQPGLGFPPRAPESPASTGCHKPGSFFCPKILTFRKENTKQTRKAAGNKSAAAKGVESSKELRFMVLILQSCLIYRVGLDLRAFCPCGAGTPILVGLARNLLGILHRTQEPGMGWEGPEIPTRFS